MNYQISWIAKFCSTKINKQWLWLDLFFHGTANVQHDVISPGNSIDSSVYRETYELFKQINSGVRDPGEAMGNLNTDFPSNLGNFTSSLSNGSALHSEGLKSQSGDSYQNNSSFVSILPVFIGNYRGTDIEKRRFHGHSN
jgi:hypothetical protein